MICFLIAAGLGYLAHESFGQDRKILVGLTVFILACGLVSVLNG